MFRYKVYIFILLMLMAGCGKAEPITQAVPTDIPPATILPVAMTATAPPTAVPTPLPPTQTAVLPTQTAVPPVVIDPQNLAVINAGTAAQVARLNILDGHSDRVMTLAFSWDSLTLASFGRERMVILWNIWNGQAVQSLHVQRGDLNFIAFSPVENWLVAGNSIWDVESLQKMHTLGSDSREPIHPAFSADGSRLAIAIFNQPIRLWDIASEQVVQTFEQVGESLTFAIEISPDGSLLAAAEPYGLVRLWDVASGQVVGTLEYGSNGNDVHDIAFSPDGRLLVAIGTTSTVRVWDVANGQVVQTMSHGEGMYGVAISPDGSLVASAGCDRTVKLWDLASGRRLATLNHADEVITVAFSPDGRLLASGGYDDLIYLWGVTR
jgi:WD40 repeat protein